MLAHLKRFKDSKSPINCHAAIYQCKSGNLTKKMLCIKTDAELESQTAGMIITIIVVVKVSVGAFMPPVSASVIMMEIIMMIIGVVTGVVRVLGGASMPLVCR